MRAFAYLRVSTKEQLDKTGLARQQELVHAFIAAKGWSCVRTFSDQKSGGAAFQDRLTLIEMLELAPSFNVEAVVVERADRIARDLMTQELFLSKCSDQRLLVYCADSGEEITLRDADPTRIMLRQVVGALAQWEKAMLVRKLQDGRRRTKLLTGRPCGGIPGYGRTGPDDLQMYEQSIMKWIVERRHEGMKFLDIARMLNDKPVPAPGGGKYWHKATVYRMWRKAQDDFDIFPKVTTSSACGQQTPHGKKN